MGFNKEHARQLLKSFSFKELFVEELGWDHFKARPISLKIENDTFVLTGLVEKRGMTVFECSANAAGVIPQSPIRKKIENQIRKTAVEHIIIYTDSRKTHQKWQWIRREASRPIASREHDFIVSQSGEALLQKLSHLEIAVDEESVLTIFGVTTRAQKAFDIDKVTKKFYERFKQEHSAFLKFIKGIEAQGDREWYASLMLNRLMFCYFIQKKGFLDGDIDYLRKRLNILQDKKGKDKFFSFYRHFLLKLFHEGLGKREHSVELDALIGKVPYLNGGFFDIHKLEAQNLEIDIPDKAFEKVFDFFDDFHWHLDERPLRNDKEINPDVLGYIFEKYINQKQMGAYYTKEDITGYISKNTIIPWLFDATKKKCEIAFQPDSAMWRLLKDDPDRYLYPAMRKGVIADQVDVNSGIADKTGVLIPLPNEIAGGINDVSQRGNWNSACDDKYALPTEIWREYIARRQRCIEIREKMHNGELHQINELITNNLDIAQFAEDAISKSEGPEFLRAMYEAITCISVLDPTCGSGAFLFAGLNILEELYDACINKMEVFVADADLAEPGNKKYKDFRSNLEQMNKHPSRKYFIYNSIIINNLFGVDIMEEAVEICKLRLFLKLVAQVETGEQIEPLPDIDFNIRAGNTLVGFATLEQFKNQSLNAFAQKQYGTVIEEAEKISMVFARYKSEQIEDKGGDTLRQSKRELNKQLDKLNDKLNRFLAVTYLGRSDFKETDFETWKLAHLPFHWFAEFYEKMNKGGFDVIIGNPPYLEFSEVTYNIIGFSTFDTKAIHVMCIERSLQLVKDKSNISMIVPLALVSTQRMAGIQRLLEAKRSIWYSNYSWRPGKLFDTVNRALTIFCCCNVEEIVPTVFSTCYQKWTSETRAPLMQLLSYCEIPPKRKACWVPKLGNKIEIAILNKILSAGGLLGAHYRKSNNKVFYRTTGGLYWKVFTDFAPAFKANGKKGHSSRETFFTVDSEQSAKAIVAVLSSDVFWWWYTVTSNLRDLNPYDIQNFPISPKAIEATETTKLGFEYINDLIKNSRMLVRQQKQTGKTETQSFVINLSKPMIEKIDMQLAKYYKFTPEELDYIINYDIKFRMGSELDGEEI